ncbi:MAG: hypothetical protein ACE5I3_13980 [Phycisphaerae bacterium]
MASQEKLGAELLKQNSNASAVAASPLVDRIVRRERWRVRWWAIATAALWIITAAYLLGLLWFYAVFIHPVMHEYFTSEYVAPDAMKPHMLVVIALLKALLWWPGLLFAAAVCTTFLTLASRRATLRQIQASLTEISVQLKALASKP